MVPLMNRTETVKRVKEAQYGSGRGAFETSFAKGNWEKKVGKEGTGDWISRSHDSAEPSSAGPCIGMAEISGILDMTASSEKMRE